MTLDTIVINDITLGRILAWLLAVVVVLALPRACRMLFRRRRVSLQHMTYVVCGGCGWEGHISKFGTRCPGCNAPVQDPPADGGHA